MAHTIAFINEKGGIGKSSICFNTAWCLATLHGKKTLMIDMDGQRANLTFFTGIEKPKGLPTMYDVLVDKMDIRQTVLVVDDEIAPNLHIIPATDDVTSLNNDNADLGEMKQAITMLSPYYDFIFIDVSPTPNRSHALAMAAADSVIIPNLPDITSLEANMGIIESLSLVRNGLNPGLKVLGIVFNRYVWRPVLSRRVNAAAEEMAKAMETKVFDTKIRSAVVLSENVGANLGITSYAPKSSAADDYKALCEEIIKEVESK